jgi:hypothetical protein
MTEGMRVTLWRRPTIGPAAWRSSQRVDAPRLWRADALPIAGRPPPRNRSSPAPARRVLYDEARGRFLDRPGRGEATSLRHAAELAQRGSEDISEDCRRDARAPSPARAGRIGERDNGRHRQHFESWGAGGQRPTAPSVRVLNPADRRTFRGAPYTGGSFESRVRPAYFSLVDRRHFSRSNSDHFVHSSTRVSI